jgi:dephospho-CoA kinase
MILIGLTGGIASGKSTAAKMLADRGAVIIDADQIAREIVEPGKPAHDEILERFGYEVAGPDGAIDRARLGEIVFTDEAARKDLEAITHPAIFAEILRRIDQERSGDRLVVVDAALLVESLSDRGKSIGIQALVVVSAAEADQLERIARDRPNLSAEQARARMGAQAFAAEKLAAADYILDNRGSLQDLEHGVELLWKDLHERFGR